MPRTTDPVRWPDLIARMALSSPPALRGVFVEPRYRLEVVFAPAFRFNVVRDGGVLREITDGQTTFLLEGDEVRAHWADELVVHNQLRSFIIPTKFVEAGDIQNRTLLAPIARERVLGRDAFIARVSGDERAREVEAAIDSATGMVLRLRGGDIETGFEWLETDIDVGDEMFRWTGPITRDERPSR